MPIDPVGATIGAASLAIQLLDGVALGFKYFLEAANMPAHALELRTKLRIEYHRFLSWAEVSGLLEHEYEQDLPEILKADKLVLVAVLTQIKAIMEDFAAINGRYDPLKDNDTAEMKEKDMAIDISSEMASITIKYEKAAKKRKHLRGTNHALAMVKSTKEIVMQPKRLWWVAFDKEVFKNLLQKLSEYNGYLAELMQGHHARKLEQTTRNTFVEMVQVRSSVEELKRLVTASMILNERQVHVSVLDLNRAANDKLLESLALFKRSAIVAENPTAEKPPLYEAVIKSTHKPYTSVQYEEKPDDPNAAEAILQNRTNGKFDPGDGREVPVWIEWKTYVSRVDRKQRAVPLPKNVQRVAELVTLLQMDKPKQFHVPKCLGYFDDREDQERSNHEERFGLIFEKPAQSQQDFPPITLQEAIHDCDCPPLNERIAIAHQLASSLLYFHAVGWLHRALRPDSVIFFREFSPFKSASYIKYSEPSLTNFDYARPDRDGTNTTTSDTARASKFYDLYRHPDYQGTNAQGKFRKSFDIYSFGILLLEIAAWEPIQALVAMEDYEKATSDQMSSISQQAMSTELLDRLEQGMGPKYRLAVETCIKGRGALGLDLADDETDVVVGAKMQRSFTEKVLNALEGIIT